MQIKIYTEKEKAIGIIGEIDVLVVGGGPAGIGAAIGAARAGTSVMIVEAAGSFGGMWTNGLVITLAGFNNWLRPYQRCVNGVMGEWLELAGKDGGSENNRSWVLNSDPEMMKLAADEMLLENGVKCLLHTWMADVIKEGQDLKGVIVENVDGRKAILAKVVVDCTGNGDVFVRADAPFHIAPELQPMTLPFYLAEVETGKKIPFEEELVVPFGPEPGFLGEPLLSEYTSRRRDVDIDRKKLNSDKGILPYFGGPWFGGLRKNYPWVNTTRVYGSAVNATELTAAEMEARKNVYEIVSYYRKECDGFENSWLMKTASTIGIRETRRLDGVYTLTKEDIVANRSFPDPVALGVWPIDVHPQKGQIGMHDMYVPLPYQIPFRALLPKALNNLVVAGRCISTDRQAIGSVRVGATCGALGHAAGIAAALSAKSDLPLQSLDYADIWKELNNQHAITEL
jgi:hypothetical protein